MKKATETKISTRWQKWPTSSKEILICVSLAIVFTLSVFFLLNRLDKKIRQHEYPIPPAASADLEPLKTEIAVQGERLAKMESILSQQEPNLQTSHKLIAFEILNEILEGRLSLSNLTLYLQKNAEPWTTDILTTLSPLKESKTYDQLQALFILSPSPQSLSRWQRIKNVIKSFVRIRKLNSKVGHSDDILEALQAHKIQKALEIFDKLPPGEQTQLSSWKEEAQDRLTLETLKQKLLLEISEGN